MSVNSENDRKLVSVVIPVFNEAQSLRELNEQIQAAFRPTNYDLEIIIVDDGSRDGSATVAREIAKAYPNVNVTGFQRNRGKAAALNEGFRRAQGDFVATIDADLQDDPEAIPAMLNYLQEAGYDLVSGWKQKRQDKFIKKRTSRFFNFITCLMTGLRLHDINNGLKVYRAEVVKSIYLYGELHRFIPVLARVEGFTSGEFKVRHFPRKYGKTKYGPSRFYKGLLDLLTVLFITRFMKRPMHFFGLWGIVIVLIGLLSELWVLILKFAFHEPFQDHVALMIFGVLLIVFGMQFFSLGLISEMITFQNRKDK
ncbi:MAG: glycosyltransferase family 2 protein [Candidatus Neomarinimicrobiota bacterium]